MGTIDSFLRFRPTLYCSMLFILLAPEVGLEFSIKRIFNNMQVSG